MATKRIRQELTNLQHDPPETLSTAPTPQSNDPHLWTADLVGPAGTPYANRTFALAIRFPENYPFTPPRLTLTTSIFHPNISPEGQVRLADLDEPNWCTASTVRTVLLSLQALLSDPDPLEGVLNEEAAWVFLEDVKAFWERAAGGEKEVEGQGV